MKKIFSLLVAAVMSVSMFADVTDVLTATDLAATSNQYADFSGVKKNTAVYAGQSATSNDAIQLRSKNSNSGIVTTTSGGTLKSISVEFNSETADTRMLDVYVSNTAFTSAADLYATGDGQVGEKVASLTKEQTSFDFTTLTTEYQYIGIRSNNSALYLNSVSITWASDGSEPACVDNYLLRLNDERDLRGVYNEEMDQWEYVGIDLKANDIVQIHSLCADVDLTVNVAQGADFFEQDEADLMVVEDGKYSFYLKLSYGNDQLYVVKEEMTYSTCADVNAAEDGAEVTLGAFDVIYTRGSNIYIKDATGTTLIYANNYGLANNNHVEAGLKGTVSIYNGLPELKPTTTFDELTVTENEGYVKYDDAKTVPTADQVNQLFIYRGVSNIASVEGKNRTYTGTFMGETVTFYDNWKMQYPFDAEKYYDIFGCVAIYNDNVQVYLAEVYEVEAPVEMQTLYFNPAEQAGNYKYAVYYWNEAGAQWSDFMTVAANEENIYTAKISAGFTNVIFVAFNADVENTSWESFVYQTGDLVVPADADMFTIEGSADATGKFSGSWSKYVYVEPCVENYGLMEVTGRYIEGTYNEELQQWEILKTKFGEGAGFQVFNRCENEPLNVAIAQGAEYFDVEDKNIFVVKEAGVYSFYLKLSYGNDQLYVVKEETPVDGDYASSADVNTAENGTELTLGEFVVVYANDPYYYIQDASGMTLIYKRGYGLQAGDNVATGMQGAVSIYNTLPEFVPTTAYEDLDITQGTVPAIAEATAVPTMADINRMFIYKGISFGEVLEGNVLTINATFKGEDIVFYDRFNVYKEMFAQLEAPARVVAEDKTYSVTGCVASFKGNMQVYITAIVEETQSGIVETMQEAKVSKMMIDGQLYILRDGKLYNAQGTMVK